MSMQVDVGVDRPVDSASLSRLFEQTDWAKARGMEDIETMLEATSFHVTAWVGGELVGFLRVLTDRRFRAFVEDVIVDQAHRSSGIGSRLVEVALQELDGVEEVALGCLDTHVSYYERFGFKRVGHACMQRASQGQ